VILRSASLSFSLILLVTAIAVTPTPARASSKQAEEAGAVLFRDKGCSYCHGVAGTGGKKGPILTNLRTDKQWPPEKITTQIMNGGQKMPPFSDSLSDVEIADLVAYLRAKHKPVPPPAPMPPPAPAAN
jgi:mono/diheme cytochrome c family protein